VFENHIEKKSHRKTIRIVLQKQYTIITLNIEKVICPW